MRTCATCGKPKADKQFRQDARATDQRALVCNGCRADKTESDAAAIGRILASVESNDRHGLLTRVFGALPTIDIDGVPILAAGGPYFGTGSPPEGDFFTKADLELFAEQTNKLQAAGELTPPSKLGHSEEQRLLENSGLPVGDELPAAGWLTNFRVAELGGVWKLLADVKGVPAKLGQIFQAGGYRTRSVELSNVTSQVDGTKYNGVITGLAWLGAKAPAVRTLDDIWNLYAVGDVVWEEEDGIMDLICDLTEAINEAANPDQPSYMWTYWVSDVNLKLNSCVIEDWDGDQTWVASFKIQKTGPNGEPNVPVVVGKDKWIPATMKLVEIDPAQVEGDEMAEPMADSWDEGYSTAAGYSERRRAARQKFARRAADTKGMKLSDEQVKSYAGAFGIEGEGAALRTSVEAHIRELAGETTPPAATPATPAAPAPVALSSAAEVTRALEAIEVEGMTADQVKAFAAGLAPVLAPLAERANRGDQAYADRFAEVRDNKILEAVRSYRLAPADREQWVEFWNANPELAAKHLAALPVNPVLILTYGSDQEHPVGEDGQPARELAAGTEAAYLIATGAADPIGATA